MYRDELGLGFSQKTRCRRWSRDSGSACCRFLTLSFAQWFSQRQNRLIAQQPTPNTHLARDLSIVQHSLECRVRVALRSNAARHGSDAVLPRRAREVTTSSQSTHTHDRVTATQLSHALHRPVPRLATTTPGTAHTLYSKIHGWRRWTKSRPRAPFAPLWATQKAKRTAEAAAQALRCLRGPRCARCMSFPRTPEGQWAFGLLVLAHSRYFGASRARVRLPPSEGPSPAGVTRVRRMGSGRFLLLASFSMG